MDTSGRFKINLTALPSDGATFNWQLDDAFFDALDEQEIQHGNLDVTLRVNRKSGAFELHFQVKGDVCIPCNRCLEPMTQPIDTEAAITVKLGEQYDDDGEVITVPETEPEVDVAWNLYEIIALDIPIYHVHPDGQCSEEVNQLFAQEQDEDDKPNDSRWDALKALLDNDKR